MFVERNIFKIKYGCLEEAVKLCDEYKSWWRERKVTVRIYTPAYAPMFTLCLEFEYPSMAECERISNEWEKSPELAALSVKWVNVVERGGTSEAWWRREL